MDKFGLRAQNPQLQDKPLLNNMPTTLLTIKDDYKLSEVIRKADQPLWKEWLVNLAQSVSKIRTGIIDFLSL